LRGSAASGDARGRRASCVIAGRSATFLNASGQAIRLTRQGAPTFSKPPLKRSRSPRAATTWLGSSSLPKVHTAGTRRVATRRWLISLEPARSHSRQSCLTISTTKKHLTRSSRVNRKYATGHFDGEAGNTGRVIRSFLWRALRSTASGRYKLKPFFTAQGKLIADGKPVHD
jgi:hypothetical protein